MENIVPINQTSIDERNNNKPNQDTNKQLRPFIFDCIASRSQDELLDQLSRIQAEPEYIADTAVEKRKLDCTRSAGLDTRLFLDPDSKPDRSIGKRYSIDFDSRCLSVLDTDDYSRKVDIELAAVQWVGQAGARTVCRGDNRSDWQ